MHKEPIQQSEPLKLQGSGGRPPDRQYLLRSFVDGDLVLPHAAATSHSSLVGPSLPGKLKALAKSHYAKRAVGYWVGMVPTRRLIQGLQKK